MTFVSHQSHQPHQRPLRRLHVNDGLLITADLWQVAHSYHHQRQTIHYQAHHQGGIVDGLGISVSEIPDEAPSRYRYPRWLIIQPGLAIDGQGNPIVVPQPEQCYLSADPTEDTTIYIVLKYSEQGPQTGTEIVQDAFQIIEKDVPAEADEVELCRVRLTPGMNGITVPDQVFTPDVNQLDVRYRQPAQGRSPLCSRVYAWERDPAITDAFESLFAAIPALYPMLQGQMVDSPAHSDLSYVTYDEFCEFDSATRHQVARYVQQGGVLLIDAHVDVLLDLFQAEMELQRAIATNQRRVPVALMQTAQEELAETQTCIQEAIATLAAPIQDFLDREGLSNPPGNNPSSNSPGSDDIAETAAPSVEDWLAHALDPDGESSIIRSQPFAFHHCPTVHDRPLGIYSWQGVVLVVGPLLQSWGATPALYLERDEIRYAQEFGINLLTFAARYRQMGQWLRREE